MANTINGPAVGALSLIHVVGINAMYGLVYRNGYIQALLHLREHGPYLLPGSDHPILQRFSGIGPLDRLLVLAGVMFANITDGSAPQLSLYGFYFAGQLIPIFAVLAIESMRAGNKKTAMSQSVLWGFAMQATGYGFTMPMYAMAHLLTSTTAGEIGPLLGNAVRVSDLALLESLPAALVLGCVIPTVLMAVPLRSNQFHQWLGAFWQGFPLWVVLIQHILGWRKRLGRGIGPSAERENPLVAAGRPAASSGARTHETHVLYSVCRFAFVAAAACHWITFGIIGLSWFSPRLFSPELRRAFTVSEVFWPPPFWAPGQMPSMASGIHNFFQYDLYVGSVAAFSWAITLILNATRPPFKAEVLVKSLCKMLAVNIFAGPGSALISLVLERDKMVSADDAAHHTE